jgi:hypothetical protein
MLWHKAQGAGGVGGSVELTYSVAGSDFELGAVSNTQFSKTMSIGAEPEAGQKRVLVVVESGAQFLSGSGNISTSSASVGGTSTTKVAENLSPSTSFKQYVAVHTVEVSTGTTATVVLNSVDARGFGVQVYAVYLPSANDLTLFDSGTDGGTTTLTSTVDVPSGDSLAVAAAQYRNGEATPSLSFSGTLGIATDYRQDILSDENFYAGSVLKSASGTGLTAITSDASAAGAESVSIACVFYET